MQPPEHAIADIPTDEGVLSYPKLIAGAVILVIVLGLLGAAAPVQREVAVFAGVFQTLGVEPEGLAVEREAPSVAGVGQALDF